jgi:hypothetical protein
VSRSIGARYQVITAVIAAPRTTSPPVTRASLLTSHRVRGTVWLQASRQVPVSSSRPSSGAPTTTPISPGSRMRTAQAVALTPVLNLSRNELMDAGQPAPPLRARHAVRPSVPDAVRIVVPTATAKTATATSSARQAMAWLRC